MQWPEMRRGFHIGALIIRIGQGVYKGYYKGYIRYYDIGALIIRIGFGGPLYYNYNKEPPKQGLEFRVSG